MTMTATGGFDELFPSFGKTLASKQTRMHFGPEQRAVNALAKILWEAIGPHFPRLVKTHWRRANGRALRDLAEANVSPEEALELWRGLCVKRGYPVRAVSWLVEAWEGSFAPSGPSASVKPRTGAQSVERDADGAYCGDGWWRREIGLPCDRLGRYDPQGQRTMTESDVLPQSWEVACAKSRALAESTLATLAQEELPHRDGYLAFLRSQFGL